MISWDFLAKETERVYGVQVDWEESFFICPECGEPIYRDDWQPTNYFKCGKYRGAWYCPICETLIYEEDE